MLDVPDAFVVDGDERDVARADVPWLERQTGRRRADVYGRVRERVERGLGSHPLRFCCCWVEGGVGEERRRARWAERASQLEPKSAAGNPLVVRSGKGHKGSSFLPGRLGHGGI